MTFFFFWRSTQTQRRDLKLSVPTLARNLFCLSALKRIQSYGPLKVPLRAPKGFMDPQLRTTALKKRLSASKLVALAVTTFVRDLVTSQQEVILSNIT